MREHGCERRGPALVVFLREEGHGRELDGRDGRQLRSAGAAGNGERGEEEAGSRSC
jgi:hypothetical protein